MRFFELLGRKEKRELSSSQETDQNSDEEQGGPLVVQKQQEDPTEDDSSSQSSAWPVILITVLILVLGAATSVAFLWLGISGAQGQQEIDFERDASDLVKKIEAAWHDYVHAASFVHARCRGRNFTRQDFRELYEYLIDAGLDFKAVQFDPNVTHAQRAEVEAEAKAYYQENYPHVNYRGIVSFMPGTTDTEPRSNHSFYFPIHYMEPISGNEAAIDLDYYSIASRRVTVDAVLSTGKPATTSRLRLVKDPNVESRCDIGDVESYGVVLMHPGVNVSLDRDVWPRDFSSIVICIPALMRQATVHQGESSTVYIYDSTSAAEDPLFLGGVRVRAGGYNKEANLTFLEETPLSDLANKRLYRFEEMQVTNRLWTIAVVAQDHTYQPNNVFVILGGVIIFVASVFLALWVFRMSKITKLKAQAEAEKAALIIDTAKRATQTERELNDYLAHEVRNPISSAMTACSFVKTEVSKQEPLASNEARNTTLQDVTIIDNSLKFVNDLLRTMLDIHRAADKQLSLNLCPTDILHDVLEPVEGMLVQKGGKVALSVDCPRDLFAVTDSLRLKQVILNLGRNSSKFVEKGFIRFCGSVVDGKVQVAVEDSGPGIPVDKQERLFLKFQESLDVLSQGTGIGLFLCKNLTDLMGAELLLDDSYDSGIPGCPGARFVVKLNIPPVPPPLEDKPDESLNTNAATSISVPVNEATEASAKEPAHELPEELSVLFVDDDAVLRKLFSRSLKTVAPGWTIREAANGETAIKLTDTEHFDLIFMDMYMASVEKQLLGTETVAALRQKGITCRICGLSANDKEAEFIEAGADCFAMKPFPCKKNELRRELCRVLYQENKVNRTDARLSSGIS